MARLLVVDLGGTAMRAAVVDSDGGNVLARAVRRVEQVVDAPPLGRSYDGEALWDAACAAMREAVHRAGGDEPVAAVAATGQRIGCVALDGGDRVVYAGPNLDTRGAATGWVVAEAAGDQLYPRTGRTLAMLYAPARLAWLRQEVPAAFARVRRVLGLGDWLVLRLCGEAATEPSTAADLLALDVTTGAYWAELWSDCGLDPAWLPPLRGAGDRLGEVTEEAARRCGVAAGTPVAVSPADSTAAMLGGGAASPGTTLALAGSTMPVLAATDSVCAPDGVVWVSRHPVAGRGVVESNGGTAGFGWAWCAERLVGAVARLSGDAAYAQAERLAGAAPPAARDALCFSGGPAVQNATRPATFLARTHALAWPTEVLQPALGAGDVVRAALEAVAHSVRANAEQVEALASGGAAQRLVVAGGMARSRLLLGIVAAVLDRVVHTPAVGDATVIGAAACAAVSAGVHPDLDAAAGALARIAVAAEPDAELVPVYAAAHRAWRALYARMESL
jgi:autoinducer 2 (AI-2) kinase